MNATRLYNWLERAAFVAAIAILMLVISGGPGWSAMVAGPLAGAAVALYIIGLDIRLQRVENEQAMRRHARPRVVGKDGAGRLMVYDAERGVTRPMGVGDIDAVDP